MRIRLLNLWFALYTNFWFVPLMMSIAAIGLYYGAIELDRHLGDDFIDKLGWAYRGSAAGARAVLSAIASSMITVAGVVFSITIVVLQLASSQFGPRLIRGFIRDKGNQVVLGAFVATFIYCILVLRTVHDDTAAQPFVPQIAVALGVLLALLSLGVLIYYIHHVARAIRVDIVIASIARELDEAIDRIMPRGDDGDCPDPPPAPLPRGAAVNSLAVGYLQVVDIDRLRDIAAARNVVIEVRRRPGDFIFPAGLLANVTPLETSCPELESHIRSAFVIGQERTPTQDLRLPVSQLTEIAVRALSPGVNDPFTAIECIDRLGAALCRIAGRPTPRSTVADEDGTRRATVPRESFATMLAVSIDPIRAYARGAAPVTAHLLETLEIIGRSLRRAADLAVLQRKAVQIIEGARHTVPCEDLEAIERRCARILELTHRPPRLPLTPAVPAARARETAPHGNG